MKKLYTIKFFLSCFLSLTSYVITHAQAGEWTWMKGTSSQGGLASFGTQGVEASTNTPEALYGTCYWTDKQKKFWLIGGYGASGYATALWKFDPATNNWTWMKGPNTSSTYGTYGTMGVPAASNFPGSRTFGFPAWADTAGNLWLYGGYGYGGNALGSLADLWKYSIATNEWTWVAGYQTSGLTPTYGTLGVPDPANNPGSRYETTCSWTDSQNRLWFFGGYDPNGLGRSDVWMYDIATNEWTWMAGSNAGGQASSYGTQGVFASSNTPGAREVYCNWIDASDHLWLFGGGYPDRHADLWEYDITLGEWAWISGTSTLNYTGIHGPKCQLTDYFPNSRSENRIEWTDSCGNFWLYGGGDSYGDPLYNDLWQYNPVLNKWIWVSGDSTANMVSVYGTQGISSPTNKPGGRESSASWVDAAGNLWFFGGSYGSWSTPYNDVWRYVPDESCFGCQQVNVQQPPAALFNVSDTAVCENACLDFFDQSANNPTSWLWSFPGGNPSSSTSQNPTNICYSSAGVYDVTLIATNAFGSDTIVLGSLITISTLPSVSLSQSNDTLYATGAPDYQWYNAGILIGGATDNFYVPLAEGYYSVVITDSAGCTAADTIFFSFAPQANFSVPDPIICEKFCLDFTDQSGNNPTAWQWTFGGGVPATSTSQNPTNICYNTPGSYDVTLIASNASGSDTLVLQNYVTVFPTPPFPSITQVGYTLTSTSATTYQWQLNSIDIPGATNQSYTVLQSGFYTVLISDSNGCVNSASIKVTISGIDEVSDANVSIYPNPSSGSFIVEFSGGIMAGEVSIDVMNMLGQKVFSSQRSRPIGTSPDYKKEIDVSSITPGVYFLEINSNDFSVMRKIVIER